MLDADTTLSVADAPMYSNAEASRLTGLSPGRVSRWLRGYAYDYGDGRHEQPPVIRRRTTSEPSYASFLDLIDLLFVREFLNHAGLSLQKLRRALDEARTLVGAEHFARRDFFSDGSELYLKVWDDRGDMVQLLSGGQWVIAPIIMAISQQITFDATSDLAQRWTPQEGDGIVALDPAISFGRPHVAGTRITTANVYDLYLGENRSIPRVCSWFDLDQTHVRAAIVYEERLVA